MRSDFGRCVIERERGGSSLPSAKVRDFGEIIDGEYFGVTKIPISPRRQRAYSRRMLDTKSFSDVLSPVYRYLRGKIGCPWDDVFSELSEALGAGSYPIRHVLYNHILRPMERDYFEFYVDTYGRLAERKRYRWHPKPKPVHYIGTGPMAGYARVRKIWYWVKFEPLSLLSIVVDGTQTARGVAFKRQVGRKELIREVYPKLRPT